MDKRPDVVDKFATGPDELRSGSPGGLGVAQRADLTRGGTIEASLVPPLSRAAAGAGTVRPGSSLPERVLLRGYGLDPDDLELAMIKRTRR